MRWSLACVVFGVSCTLAPSSAGEPVTTASVQVTARDGTGAVVAGARVEMGRAGHDHVRAVTDARGTATLGPLTPGTWTVRVSAAGFAEDVREAVVSMPGSHALELTLRLATLVEEVNVDQGRLEAVIDPAGDSLTVSIEAPELDALPETEEELLIWLRELAGPGADIAVNGFLGGALPAKGRIEGIRIQRSMFAADRRHGSRARVEITTRQGLAHWGGDVAAAFRDDALNARNAFSDEETPEQMRRVLLSVQGPIVPGRTAVTLDVEALSEYDSETIVAATPGGGIEDLVRQPEDELEVTLGLHHRLTPLQGIHVEYRHEIEDTDNLGVGDFDLHERAYARRVRDRRLRVAHAGAFASGWRNDTRLQFAWDRDEATPASTGPAVTVLDAVTFGGASIRGRRLARAVDVDQRLERRLGAHTVTAGGRFEWLRLESDEIVNANGLFTFSSLEAFAEGRPDSFRVLTGDPAIRYRAFQGGLFLQDDVRVRSNLLVGVGLRQDWQSNVPDRRNIAPRLGVSWTPGRDGLVLVRGGFGVFNDWYYPATYEETLQVDGTRVQEIVVQSPGYPDPFSGGAVVVLPSGRIQQAVGLRLPRHREGTVAVERRIGRSGRVDVTYARRDAIDQLRSRNVNAPVGGVRPDPSLGNVVEIRSIGRARVDEVSTGGTLRLPWRALVVSGRYVYGRARDDGDDPLALPADPDVPDEWGPARDDVRHQGWVFAVAEPVRNLRMGATLSAASAPPYTITTGRDDNGDGIFNDRPPGVGRNSARAAGYARLDLRVAWRVGAGLPDMDDTDRGWRARHRVMGELYLRATNALNGVHPVRFSGVLTSPFFGEPAAAREARRLEIGARVVF
jgi:hypothetical protein